MRIHWLTSSYVRLRVRTPLAARHDQARVSAARKLSNSVSIERLIRALREPAAPLAYVTNAPWPGSNSSTQSELAFVADHPYRQAGLTSAATPPSTGTRDLSNAAPPLNVSAAALAAPIPRKAISALVVPGAEPTANSVFPRGDQIRLCAPVE
jgi:hypothetical protein